MHRMYVILSIGMILARASNACSCAVADLLTGRQVQASGGGARRVSRQRATK